MSGRAARPGGEDCAASYRRSVLYALRAYPPRYRETRGAEIVDLLADLAEPGARRLPLATRTDLLRGGLAVRLRDRPPVLAWAGYRVFGRRLPDCWRAWVRDDIGGRFYPMRQLLLMVLTQAAVWGCLGVVVGYRPSLVFLVTYFCTLVVLSFLLAGLARAKARTRHGLDPGAAAGPGPAEPAR